MFLLIFTFSNFVHHSSWEMLVALWLLPWSVVHWFIEFGFIHRLAKFATCLLFDSKLAATHCGHLSASGTDHRVLLTWVGLMWQVISLKDLVRHLKSRATSDLCHSIFLHHTHLTSHQIHHVVIIAILILILNFDHVLKVRHLLLSRLRQNRCGCLVDYLWLEKLRLLRLLVEVLATRSHCTFDSETAILIWGSLNRLGYGIQLLSVKGGFQTSSQFLLLVAGFSGLRVVWSVSHLIKPSIVHQGLDATFALTSDYNVLLSSFGFGNGWSLV